MPDTPKITEAEAEAETERLCEVMHDAYEDAAVEEGWETQQRSRKPWTSVPEANKRTMRRAVRALLDAVKAQTEPPAEDVREALAGAIRDGDMMLPSGALALVEWSGHLADAILDRFAVSPKKGQD